MHTRFVTSFITGVAGAFVVVASQAFVAGTTAWLAFAIGIGLLVLSAAPALSGERRIVGLALDGLGGLLAIWTIVASVVFSGDVVKWLSFGEGAGFALLAAGGLVLNQVRLTRLAHAAAPAEVETVIPEEARTDRPTAVAA